MPDGSAIDNCPWYARQDDNRQPVVGVFLIQGVVISNSKGQSAVSSLQQSSIAARITRRRSIWFNVERMLTILAHAFNILGVLKGFDLVRFIPCSFEFELDEFSCLPFGIVSDFISIAKRS